MLKTILIALLLLANAAPEPARAYRVIVHPDNPVTSIERHRLSEIFLKKITTWPDDEHTAPVDLAASSPLREKFTDAVHGKSLSAVKSYWQQLIFSGRGLPPPELDSDEAVVRYVLSHRGAIGYVSDKAQIGAAKVVVIY